MTITINENIYMKITISTMDGEILFSIYWLNANSVYMSAMYSMMTDVTMLLL